MSKILLLLLLCSILAASEAKRVILVFQKIPVDAKADLRMEILKTLREDPSLQATVKKMTIIETDKLESTEDRESRRETVTFLVETEIPCDIRKVRSALAVNRNDVFVINADFQ